MTILTTASGDLDVIPEIFLPYVVEKTSELSAFFASGVVQALPALNIKQEEGGQIITMPFWQDLAGASQVLDSSTDLSVAKFTTESDAAVLHGRALSYGSTDIAADLAGSDPIMKLADLYGAKWARVMQTILIQTLVGAMANVTDNLLDISALSGSAAVFDGSAFVDAEQKMGDNSEKLVAVAMHSAVRSLIKKNDLIETEKDSLGRIYETYQGKRIIVDDGLTPTSSVYTTYLFGLGAVGYGEGFPKTPYETERNALLNSGQEYSVYRRQFVLHPRGIKWDPASGVSAKDFPSNAEVADSGNWTQAYESQNIRIVQFKHRIAAAE